MKKFFVFLLVFSFPFLLRVGAQNPFLKLYGGAGTDGLVSVVNCRAGGFAFCGTTTSFLRPNTTQNFYVGKTDAEGNLLWSRNFARLSVNRGVSLVETADGGLVFAGTIEPANTNFSEDGFLMKVNANGDSLWAYSYGSPGSSSQEFRDMCATWDGGFAMYGFTMPGSIPSGYLIKVDSLGTQSFTSSPASGFLGATGQKIFQTADSGFLALGAANPPRAFVLAKMSKTGTGVWAKRYSTPTASFAFDCMVLSDTGYLIATNLNVNQQNNLSDCRFYWVNSQGDTLKTRLYKNVFGSQLIPDGRGGAWVAGRSPGFTTVGKLFRINANGDSLWGRRYENPTDFFVGSALRTPDGGLLLGGSGGSPDLQAVLMKLDSLGQPENLVSVKPGLSGIELEPRLFPNPVETELHLTGGGLPGTEVRLLNALGQEMGRVRFDAVESQPISVRHLPSGLYRLQWVREGKSVSQTFYKK